MSSYELKEILNNPETFEKACKEMFEKIDTNKNGSIEKSEIRDHINDIRKSLGKGEVDDKALEKQFNSHDLDGDGTIDYNEFKPIYKEMATRMIKIADKLNKNIIIKDKKESNKLDDIVNKLMIEINNEDINFTEKPIQRLKEEQKYLSSLPSIDCISQYFRQNKGYKVSKESMITYKKHKYSVPIKYIGEYLTVSENEDTLNIYYTTDLIASHKISRQIFKLQKRTCS